MDIDYSDGVPRFDLKKPQAYFQDPLTLALLDAALAGDLAKAQELVARGANPDDEGPKDNLYNRIRLLHYAVAANNKPAIKVLMAVGADPELSVPGFGRALLFAITLNNLDMLGTMLDSRPIDQLTDDTVEILLFESMIQKCPDCLDLLFQRGVPIDFPDGAGYTIMMRAMDSQDYDLVESLLLQGASVDIETASGATPAASVEFHLDKYIPNSPTYNKLLRIKQLMAERGAVFPATPPDEIRARRAANRP